MSTRKYLIGFLLLSIFLAGCKYAGIHSTEPAFDPKDTLKMEELKGNYSSSDGTDYLAVSDNDGLFLASDLNCKVKDKDKDDFCNIEFSVFNLPSFEDDYVGQSILVDINSEQHVFYFYLIQEEKRWNVCTGFEDKNNLDEIMHTAALYELEYEIVDGIRVTGGMTSENMLGFLNAVWFKTSLDYWECFYLIPEDRSREELLEELRK